MTRTERQKEAVRKWIRAKGKASIIAMTGFGKSRMALMAIEAIRKKYPYIRILIVVPTEPLKRQWQEHIDNNNLQFNAEVQIINTVIKHNYTCDFLILDEEHRYPADTFSKVFDCVKYKLILGLTATFERLDGKHVIMNKYCPAVDNITVAECLANGWVSQYKEYQVLIEVDNINEYKELNKRWLESFEFFNFDFNLAKSTCGPEGWKVKLALRDEMYKGDDENKRKQVLQNINFHSINFMRTMQQRKAFINNHPKKIEIAKKIIEARSDKKIITFSNNVKMAEAIDNGEFVYTGKTSKAKGRVMMEDFISGKINRIHSCHKLNEGIDVPDISVGIVLGTDSSEIKAKQRLGRTTRVYENKNVEFFYIVIKDTIEEKWVSNNHKSNKNYITIDEQGLEKVLKGDSPEEIKQKPRELMFRF